MRINRSIISNQTESVPVGRTLTINGTTYDLTQNRTWTVSGGGVTGSGTTNYLSKWTSGTALGNSLVYDNGTNVGIGNISALSKLHVTGNLLSYSEATNTAALFIAANNSYNWQFGINNGSDYVITENGGVNGIGTIRLSMKPGGNLLVNTTTDQGQKFQVNGDALIGGLLTITGSSSLPVQTATYIRFASGFSSPDIGRMYIGDGTGWKFHMSKRISSTTTDLITFFDNGSIQTTAPSGGTAKPWKLGKIYTDPCGVPTTFGQTMTDQYIELEIDGVFCYIPIRVPGWC